MHNPFGDNRLDLTRPQVMGVLNVTPDSFSDGGQFYQTQTAVKHALAMVQQGASIIDIGGESTRPYADPVTQAEELARVIPVIESLRANSDVLISVDTSTPEVMRQAAVAGADLINDVRALSREGALAAAAETGLPVCLMHMQKQPDNMQDDPVYQDVVEEIFQFLQARIHACVQAGIAREKCLIDPGFGFGKTVAHNFTLLKHLPRFGDLQLPLLVGLSRKSMIGKAIGLPVEERLHASTALAVMATERGANIIRAHDVKPTVDAVLMAHAVLQSTPVKETAHE